jgi:NAD(P)-dependent dehydrogenase (short-subunit alcohol dehydrogenase family)
MTAPVPARVVVTGASGGIGRAIARRLIDDGASVANIDARLDPEAEALCGPAMTTVLADLADPAAIARAFGTIDALFGGEPPDLMVACAASSFAAPFLDIRAEQLDRLLAVNVAGTFHACQEAARRMTRVRTGRIVVITSVAAEQAWAGEMVYCATKAAQRSLVQGMAVELAPLGVLVNAVGPGIVEHRSAAMARTRDDGAVLAHDLDRTPLGRFASPEEIADAVAFLARTTWMNGQTIYVDGGFLAAGLGYFGAAKEKVAGTVPDPGQGCSLPRA